VVHHPDAVCAAVFTCDHQWVLVRQYRVAAGSLLLEVAGGRVDSGEEPDQAIERELREEIGYRSGRVRRLMEILPSPGFCNQRMFCYLVDQAELGENCLDEGESLQVIRVGAEEGVSLAMTGGIIDGTSVVVMLASARLLGL
jgi:ADP-ribose pyrophosphatase